MSDHRNAVRSVGGRTGHLARWGTLTDEQVAALPKIDHLAITDRTSDEDLWTAVRYRGRRAGWTIAQVEAWTATATGASRQRLIAYANAVMNPPNENTTMSTTDNRLNLAALPKVADTWQDGDGNAFAILGTVRRLARRAGWTDDQWEAFATEARAGDYDHLLRTCLAVTE